jgi:hypothetical protein
MDIYMRRPCVGASVLPKQLDFAALGSIVIKCAANVDLSFTRVVDVIRHGRGSGRACHGIDGPAAFIGVALHDLRAIEVCLALVADTVHDGRGTRILASHHRDGGLHIHRFHLADRVFAPNGCHMLADDFAGSLRTQ